MSKLIMMVIQNVRYEWSAIGNFKSNPKLLLDIELCALEEDGKALAKYGFGKR